MATPRVFQTLIGVKSDPNVSRIRSHAFTATARSPSRHPEDRCKSIAVENQQQLREIETSAIGVDDDVRTLQMAAGTRQKTTIHRARRPRMPTVRHCGVPHRWWPWWKSTLFRTVEPWCSESALARYGGTGLFHFDLQVRVHRVLRVGLLSCYCPFSYQWCFGRFSSSVHADT